MKVLRPQGAPRLLTTTRQKIRLIRELGVRHVLIVKFDQEFAATEPEDFVRQLVANSNPLREICVGHEWSFGKNRRGNLGLLQKFGAEFDFNVVGVPLVSVRGAVVSSTGIRTAEQTGDFAKAAEMLGRDDTMRGTVVSVDNPWKRSDSRPLEQVAF